MLSILCKRLVKPIPLTMGFGKNLNLRHSHPYSEHAFDPGHQFVVPDVRPRKMNKSRHRSSQQNYIEIDVKNVKKKQIPGVRHMFCTGYYSNIHQRHSTI